MSPLDLLTDASTKGQGYANVLLNLILYNQNYKLVYHIDWDNGLWCTIELGWLVFILVLGSTAMVKSRRHPPQKKRMKFHIENEDYLFRWPLRTQLKHMQLKWPKHDKLESDFRSHV